ncbi:MAG: carbohydrate kinase family protein [Hyphomicrobiaceae bacterium]|nr:carbohydrate kinase family protein [Hyphomicrobiaceae bacterium]
MKSVTIGGAMVDSIAIIDDERIERMSMRNAESAFLLLEVGRKTEASEISQHCGGGAVNAAVGMARLRFDVAAVIKLGQDARAEAILRRLDGEGVSTRWVMRDARSATGASVIISSHERDAAIFTFRGANTLLCTADLKPDMFAADVVYISGLSNESADCFPDIIRLAKSQKAMVATNPGIRQLTSRASSFRKALADIDVLSINRAEAAALVPQLVGDHGEGGPVLECAADESAPALARRGLESGGYEMSLRRFVEAMTARGVRHVVITNGMDGAYVGTAGEILHCPTLPTKVAGTAGAGDAFASTFVAWLASSGKACEALRAGIINAASVVGHADTQTGLLRGDELAQRLSTIADKLPLTRWSLSD